MIVDARSQLLLSGRKGLVVGIANENSIAYGCARMFRNCGAELGPRGIRVNAVSPGPMKTRAAHGIPDFDGLFAEARRRAPLPRDQPRAPIVTSTLSCNDLEVAGRPSG